MLYSACFSSVFSRSLSFFIGSLPFLPEVVRFIGHVQMRVAYSHDGQVETASAFPTCPHGDYACRQLSCVRSVSNICSVLEFSRNGMVRGISRGSPSHRGKTANGTEPSVSVAL
jgi:hypothetical protein